MKYSSADCPLCGRPMHSQRSICAFCEQAGLQPPANTDQTILMPPPGVQDVSFTDPPQAFTQRRGVFWEFVLAFLFPVWGLIRGLIKAFDPDPEEKRLAGINFGSAVAGVALICWLMSIAPTLIAGPGGAAYDAGIEAYQQGNYRLAATRLEEAVRSDPKLAVAWVSLSAAQLELQDGIGAETSARRAIDLFKSGDYGLIPEENSLQQMHAAAWGNLAAALIMQSRFDEAGLPADMALSIDPNNEKAPHWRKITEMERALYAQ